MSTGTTTLNVSGATDDWFCMPTTTVRCDANAIRSDVVVIHSSRGIARRSAVIVPMLVVFENVVASSVPGFSFGAGWMWM